ncbi:MAG: peptide deformylase [Candidatus Rhabdochlamydia sp.]
MKLPICYYGNLILRKKCTPIETITKEHHLLVKNMIETMDQHDGIGIAAPQIGESIRLFVLRRYIIKSEEEWDVSDPIVYINPVILNHSKEVNSAEEGCLSIPGIKLMVQRPSKITVRSMRLDGSIVEEDLEGINARVVMHENDHINGVLFIDRIPKKDIKKVELRLNALKKKTLSFPK